ncbi:CLUMA_CG005072, isoform A [Clunio marinus]|uniref:CLUMA_CG005072, isoform A n=1 Tax=Clunio marinus TaxID=568069 RepID=A0A1J1HTL1_9DIPT|nr:CLUMA_CG005072, isoform A [Clunio marinus]
MECNAIVRRLKRDEKRNMCMSIRKLICSHRPCMCHKGRHKTCGIIRRKAKRIKRNTSWIAKNKSLSLAQQRADADEFGVDP